MNTYKEEINKNSYIVATYFCKTKNQNLDYIAWNLAIGQSVGNPNVRNKWETEELYENHCCKILHNKNELMKLKEGNIKIAFPIQNINWNNDGVSQLLCFLMGGQLDIKDIDVCRLVDLELPERFHLKPKYGINGIRERRNVYNKPLLGAIIKPKTGISPQTLLEMVKELVAGGVDFIKEDEIMSNPHCCPLIDRTRIISNYLEGLHNKPIYCFCINGDPRFIIERAKFVAEYGNNGVHVNFWSGFGSYKNIRELDRDLFIHFQKSGDRILTDKSHRFGIDWKVICYLASIMGVDSIHAGMVGGYYGDSKETEECLPILRNHNVLPALSCGMHPGIVNKVTKIVGCDYMANVGGAIHGHPDGTFAGVKAMRQAIDKNYAKEYNDAILKWGTEL